MICISRVLLIISQQLQGFSKITLQWCHNERDGVSNPQFRDCLLNRLFTRRSKKNIKAPRHWHLCGEYIGDREFPTQKASNAENLSIWWRHDANYSVDTVRLLVLISILITLYIPTNDLADNTCTYAYGDIKNDSCQICFCIVLVFTMRNM